MNPDSGANDNVYLVVTSISRPNAVLGALAEGCQRNQVAFIVVGDSKSPPSFELGGCSFFSLEDQRRLPFRTSILCPEKSYSRKNVGYLIAIAAGAEVLIETDDDNIPSDDEFFATAPEVTEYPCVRGTGWFNAYRAFTDQDIWPRGFPLEEVRASRADRFTYVNVPNLHSPIQQRLADGNPDVDAIYRLLFPLPLSFDRRQPIALDTNVWCPFNSQNTVFLESAYPLLYLPSYCSFRMTDIWRSLIAQAICWVNDWRITFHPSSVFQERNEHDLVRDFADEVPGYLNNASIAEMLGDCKFAPGRNQLGENLLMAYELLVRRGLVGSGELELVSAWLDDLAMIRSDGRQ